MITRKYPLVAAVCLMAALMFVGSGCEDEPTMPEETDDRSAMTWTADSITNEDLLDIGRPVYLYITANQCSYCDQMKRETFPVYRVRRLMNDYFVNIEINADFDRIITFLGEELTSEELAERYEVKQYPTSVFLSANLEEVAQMWGIRAAERFADSAGFIGTGAYKSMEFEEYMALPEDQRP